MRIGQILVIIIMGKHKTHSGCTEPGEWGFLNIDSVKQSVDKVPCIKTLYEHQDFPLKGKEKGR